MRRFKHDHAGGTAAVCLAALLTLVYAVYAPGLSGSFLLDDYINLDALGRFGGINDPGALADYLLGSHTGTGGRPIALASFLLDGVDWPTAPEPFKYTNVLLHLLAVVGVIWLALQVAGALGVDRRRQYAIALLAGAVWGLHPYLVSTVLYVVQRMAILAAIFVLFGLGCYVRGRRLLAEEHGGTAYAWMTTGLALFTPLAFLSKPNGGLLPVLALVLNVTVLRALTVPAREHRRWRLWHTLFILLPIATIVGYFVIGWEHRILDPYITRPFTVAERLLTESRILIEYATNLVIPRIQTSGLYHDNYPVSTGLLRPPSTIFAALAILGALAAAIALRQRKPVISAAVLFFLAGHSLESSFVPLELYFEHRNYLPSVMLAFALAVGIVRLFDSRRLEYPRWVAGGTAAVLVCALATFTVARASLWGDPSRQAITWVQENPGSVRAQQRAAVTYLDLGRPVMAAMHLSAGIRHNPQSSLLRVQHLIISCVAGGAEQGKIRSTAEAIVNNPFERHTIRQLETLAGHVMAGRCPGLDIADTVRLVDAALSHTGVQTRGRMKEGLLYLRGRLLLADARPEQAQQAFMAASRIALNMEGAIQMAAIMATADHYENALALLDEAENDLNQSKPGLRGQLRRMAVDYRAEIIRLRATIREDAEQRATTR